eukprot:824458_1
MTENKKHISLKDIFTNVLLVVDDALTVNANDINTNNETEDIYQQIGRVYVANVNKSRQIGITTRRPNTINGIQQLQEENKIKNQYYKTRKPALRRQYNKNKFYFHSMANAKLHKTYKMNNRYRYNRW